MKVVVTRMVMKMHVKNFVALGLAAVLGLLGAAKANAADTLLPGQALVVGQQIISKNRQWNLTMERDGSLVVWGPNGGAWNSGSAGANRFVMQPDGNAVAYDQYDRPKFHTVSFGHEGSSISILDDGNLVVFANNGTPLWSRYHGGALPTAQGGYFTMAFRITRYDTTPVSSFDTPYGFYSNGRGRYCFVATKSYGGPNLGLYYTAYVPPRGSPGGGGYPSYDNLVSREKFDGNCR